jgi:hypothetical protein
MPNRSDNLFFLASLYSGSINVGFFWSVFPNRVSDSPVSAEKIIYEAFVLIGELRWSFSSLLQWRRKKVKTSPCIILLAFHDFIFPLGRQ